MQTLTTTATADAVPTRTRFSHESLLWDSAEEFAEGAADFVREGLVSGEPVMVAAVPARTRALRRVLGGDTARVEFVDLTELGANPARIMPALLEFVQQCEGRPARAIAESIWAGRSAAELAECELHEALLNLAIPRGTPFRLLCSYSAALGEAVIAEAGRSHPVLTRASGRPGREHAFGGPTHAESAFRAHLPQPPPDAVRWPFAAAGLRGMRHLVEGAAMDCGLVPERAADLALSVHELGSNSIQHGGGRGELLVWRDAQTLLCEVRDAGVIRDPLVGRRPASLEHTSGRGLLMVNQLCDLVQLRSGDHGTTARVHTRL